MTFSYSKTIKYNWEIIALIAGIAMVITLVIAILQPFKYQATTKLLIIQNQNANLDAYTATKSAEKIGTNLVQVVSSTIFYDEVIKANPRLAGEFPKDELKRRKAWQKDVEAIMTPETGILEISAYHQDKALASELSQTVAMVLVNKGSEFHGGGDSVIIKIIDDVYVGNFPVRPNLPLNLAFALIVGTVMGVVFVVLNESKKAAQYSAAGQDSFETAEQPAQEVSGMSFQPVTEDVNTDYDRGWRIVEEEV